MKRKTINNTLLLIIGFFILYTAYYYFADGSDSSSKRLTFTAVASILAGVTWGVFSCQILKSRVSQVNNKIDFYIIIFIVVTNSFMSEHCKSS